MTGHIVPRSVYFLVFAVLIFLTGLTTGVSFLDLGVLNTPIAMAIAVGKALLVVLFFMHVRYSGQMVRVAAAAAILWLIILLVLTLSDYFTRGWISNAPGW